MRDNYAKQTKSPGFNTALAPGPHKVERPGSLTFGRIGMARQKVALGEADVWLRLNPSPSAVFDRLFEEGNRTRGSPGLSTG